MIDARQSKDALHRLKFTFGEYCFYSAWFEAAEVTTHVTRLQDCLDQTAASAIPLLRRYGAVAIPSHPISAEPGWLKITREYLRYVPATTVHHFIEPGGSFNDYLRHMPRKSRHESQRKLRRFAKSTGGEIDFRIYRCAAEAEVFYPLACAVSDKTYQQRLLDVGLARTAAFEAELLGQARHDQLRGYLLFYRETPIAYAYCTVTGDSLRFRSIGYDPACSDLSVGIVLIYQALRAAIDEGRFAVIDFGSGEAQYKRAFATGSLRCASVFLFRPTLRHFAMVVAHRACIAASDSCALVLRRLGVKARLKRFFRRRARLRPPGRLSRT